MIANLLGIHPGAEMLAAITRKYGAAETRLYAAGLAKLPNIMTNPDNPEDIWCPRTQIHRGHVGQMISGRWRDLPHDQRREIDDHCAEQAAAFGYDCAG